MTYETWLWVDEKTKRFHKHTGKHPTKAEAIRHLREGRRKWFFSPGASWGKFGIKRRSYTRFVILELIRRIAKSPENDPIKVFYEFESFMDDALGRCNEGFSYVFARDILTLLPDVLELLY